MTSVEIKEQHFPAAFQRLEPELRKSGPSWLFPARRAALARFAETGFPTRRDEEWKYTNVAPLASVPYAPAGEPGEPFRDPAQILEDVPGARWVFVDGLLRPDLGRGKLPAGVTLAPLAEALGAEPEGEATFAPSEDRPENAFSLLNTALFREGVLLRVEAGVEVDEPIQVIYLASEGPNVASFTRLVVEIGSGARASIVEGWYGPPGATNLTSAVSDLRVGEGARLDHYRLQEESDAAAHIALVRSRQGKDSVYTNHFFSAGGRLVRNEIDARLEGTGGDCTLNGLYQTDADRHCDNHTILHHLVPHCHSWEMYRGILGGRSRGVFSGKINVYEDAQKTDAKQNSSSLLLSPDAEVDTRPRLEIYADDVRCTHGATVGQLDADALFYLRSRGISEVDARNLLVRAFAGVVIEEVPIEPLRHQVESMLYRRLPGKED